MDPAEIVVHNVQRHGCHVILELFAKAICQPSKTPLAHSQREILPFNIAGRNGKRVAAYYLALYCYYIARGITPPCFD
jgi:hypothetical protein